MKDKSFVEKIASRFVFGSKRRFGLKDLGKAPTTSKLRLEALEKRELLAADLLNAVAYGPSPAPALVDVPNPRDETIQLDVQSSDAERPLTTNGATWTVTSTEDSATTAGTLRYAINNANDGDKITFDKSLQGKQITLNGSQLEITKGITIDASNLYDAQNQTPGVTISGNYRSRVFYVSAKTSDVSITLNGLKIVNGGLSSESGAGVYVNSGTTVTFTNSTISDNRSDQSGGGVFVGLKSTVTFDGSAILSNVAKNSGGGIYSRSTIVLNNSRVEGNRAKKGDGGGIHGSVQTTNGTIYGNYATGDGGGVYGRVQLTNGTISHNSADGYGGGVYSSNATITNAAIVDNNAGKSGGGVYLPGSTTTTSAGKATFTNVTIAGNCSSSGAGVYAGGESIVALSNTIVAENDGEDFRSVRSQTAAQNVLSSYTSWGVSENAFVYDQSLSLFKDYAKGDYSLTKYSQARDRGNDAYAVDADGKQLTTDVAGKTRFYGTVDLGAYEYQGGTEEPETRSTVVTTLTDSSDEYDGEISLRNAIEYAGTNGLSNTVTFAPSLKGQTITLNGKSVQIRKGLTIDASNLYDAENQKLGITISGNQNSRVFCISGGTSDSPVELVGLNVHDGGFHFEGGIGGGIYTTGTTSLRNCNIIANDAYKGGGIYAYEGTTTLTNCQISNRAEKDGGGMYVEGGTASLIDCEIDSNDVWQEKNSRGGGIYADSATTSFTNCKILDNHSGGSGAGIYAYSGTTTLTNCSVTKNEIDKENVIDGEGKYSGGGIYVFAGKNTILTDCEIIANVATGSGGGIILSGDASLTNCTISYNEAGQHGGGINGSASLTNCTIIENTAKDGGGIYGSFKTLAQCTITNNHADKGGGVYINGKTTATNCVVTNNEAYNGAGGGVYINHTNDDETNLTNCTIADNSAGNGIGGGVYVNSGKVTLSNTIIASNSADSDADFYDKTSATIARNVLSSYDWVDGENCILTTADSRYLFKDSAHNDYSPSPNASNLIIDKGNDVYAVDGEGCQLDFDRADNPRFNKTVDIGAYEYRDESTTPETPSTVVTTLTDSLDEYDGLISLRNAITYAGTNGLGTTITFDESLKGQTITLNGTELKIRKNLTIDASSFYDVQTGTPGITISGDKKSRVFYVGGGVVTLNGLKITNGKADKSNKFDGGGVYVTSDSSVTLTNTTISGNEARNGGGVYGSASLMDCTVSGNTATYDGGGVYGSASLMDCTVSGNTAEFDGGGVCSSESLVDCTVSGNTASNGGGVYGTASLMDCTVSGNTASYGGGVYGSPSLIDCTVSGNTASYNGGGIYTASNSTVTLTNSSVSGNTAEQSGGGVYVDSDSKVTMTNTTVLENSAGKSGGGVYVFEGSSSGSSVEPGGTAIMTNVTIAGNSSSFGAGIYTGGIKVQKSDGTKLTTGGSVTLINAVVAENNGSDVYNYNLGVSKIVAKNVLSSFTAWDTKENTFVYDPLLSLFQDSANGDYSLTICSQARDRGNDAYAVDAEGKALTSDIVGAVRFNGTVDLGAYERQGESAELETPSTIVTTLEDSNEKYDGLISLRNAIEYAGTNGLGTVITFDESLKGQTIFLKGKSIDIRKVLTIDASEFYDEETQTPGITIDGNQKSGVLYISGGYSTSPVVLNGLTITGGNNVSSGAGIDACYGTTEVTVHETYALGTGRS